MRRRVDSVPVTVKHRDKARTKIYINLEAQKSFYPGYDLTTRGMIHLARMISQQMDVEYTPRNYGGVKKVYSIFVCLDVPEITRRKEKAADSIVRFSMKPSVLHDGGSAKEVLCGRYDLMSLILIRLGNWAESSETH